MSQIAQKQQILRSRCVFCYRAHKIWQICLKSSPKLQKTVRDPDFSTNKVFLRSLWLRATFLGARATFERRSSDVRATFERRFEQCLSSIFRKSPKRRKTTTISPFFWSIFQNSPKKRATARNNPNFRPRSSFQGELQADLPHFV